MPNKSKKLERVHSHIRKDQKKFIKTQSKLKGVSEGEIFRTMIDEYINRNNKK